MNQKKNFSPAHHIPHYSRVILQALKTPILIYTAMIGNIITFGSSVIFWVTERSLNPNVDSFFDAIWWGFCTVSTVGYGDIVPVTVVGRILSMMLMVFGITFFVGFTAILVAIIAPMAIQEQISKSNTDR